MNTNLIKKYLFNNGISYFKIKDGEIETNYCKDSCENYAQIIRTNAFIDYIKPTISNDKSIYCEFFFCYEDALPINKYKRCGIPFLTYSIDNRYAHINDIMLIPNHDIQIGLTQHTINQVKLYDIPFEQKMDKALFVGSSTGNDDRMLFCEMALDSNLIDAYITNIVQITEKEFLSKWNQKIIKAPMSIQDQLKYKYLINIDGNASTYSRMYWQSISNSRMIQFGFGEYYVDLFGYYGPAKTIKEIEDIILDEKKYFKYKFKNNFFRFKENDLINSVDKKLMYRVLMECGECLMRKNLTNDNNGV